MLDLVSHVIGAACAGWVKADVDVDSTDVLTEVGFGPVPRRRRTGGRPLDLPAAEAAPAAAPAALAHETPAAAHAPVCAAQALAAPRASRAQYEHWPALPADAQAGGGAGSSPTGLAGSPAAGAVPGSEESAGGACWGARWPTCGCGKPSRGSG